MKEFAKYVISKMMSARFLMAVMFAATYCGVMVGCVVLTVKKILPVEAFLGIFAGFSGVATMIYESYFKREDRKVS